MFDIRRIMVTKILLIKVALLITCAPLCTLAQQQPNDRLVVGMTLVSNTIAETLGAFCLDGSLPAYHIHSGFDSGARNWLLQFEGGGWCNDLKTCSERAKTERGSTRLMSKFEVFSGILSNDSSLNPDFYNWNRVKIRYCDGGSFAGNSQFGNGTSMLYFRGQKIWQAVIQDLLPKGLSTADKALLSGCSAGGLATFLHCDNFTNSLPSTASVKCLSDAGFFIDIPDIRQTYKARSFYNDLISLQGVDLNLDTNCSASVNPPQQCFFPQYMLGYIRTPYFILNSAYDVFQFHHHFIPPSSDPQRHWTPCSLNLTACSVDDINVLQGLRNEMLKALDTFYKNSGSGGMFINSCFAHCQSESQDTWLAIDSPRIHNTTIAAAVGNWYFGRNMTKLIDDPYPCSTTCHNII